MSNTPEPSKRLPEQGVGLASNTRNLLLAEVKSKKPTIRVEYHFLSGRELYDKNIITADRYSSGAAAWALRFQEHFYRVTVISRPFRRLPQILCLSFDGVQDESAEVAAIDFLSVLSVFAREPLVPLGVRRFGNDPIILEPESRPLIGQNREVRRPPMALDSQAIQTILKGIAESEDDDVNAALAACKFYRAALSFMEFDRSMAYVSFVSAIECLAGRYYQNEKLAFDQIKDFESFNAIIQELSGIPGASHLPDQLKAQLLEKVYRLRQRFVTFIELHLSDDFWVIPDTDYDEPSRNFLPKIGKADMSKRLKAVYDARSEYVHSGVPFPQYVEVGSRDRIPIGVVTDLINLPEQKRPVPPVIWFERVVHLVIGEFMTRTFAIELVKKIQEHRDKRAALLEVIKKLPDPAKDSLARLTKWTARWVGYAVIGPYAPNKEWADSPKSVEALRAAGLVEVKGSDAEGSSTLKNRRVGEAAGEFVFGSADNPLRDSELLLPEGFGDE
ncbi:MAG: hypothetical protein WBR26_05930 [Candidatus Acidiferrum sp.]